jgi:threonine dehydrogenase-like Zn-dependent dehydrogenase
MCQKDHPHHCLNRKTLGIHTCDGAFAEYLCAPISNLTFVPEELPDEDAVFAEPLSAALEILEQYNFSEIKDAAVIGDGKLGLLIAMCLSSQGINVSLIGHHPEKYSRLNNSQIHFFTSPPKQKFPLVIEATGNPAGFNDALMMTQAKGCLVLKSTYTDSFEFNPAVLVVNEITLLGSRCGPMDKAVALMDSHLISPRCLIDETFSLKNGLQAIEEASKKGVLKVLVKP